ncbi:MAG: iron ABC transporter permease, partial [Lachnospiraceae bacterium]|nr:iron ABC transporter permease [Lachnospiraceae bacterium]
MKKNRPFIILSLFILLLFSSCLGLFLGSVFLSPGEVIRALFSGNRDMAYTLVTTVRIPRVAGGLFAGMGLACAGVILQGVMNNSLASPNTIGVNSGSGFAVMLAMMLFPSLPRLVPAFAFSGALLTTLFIFLLAYLADSSRT